MAKRKTKIKKEPISKKILEYLAETSKDALILGAKIMFEPRSLMRGMSLYGDPRYYMPREISNLKKNPYFYFKEEKFYVTQKGRIKIIRNIIKNKKIKSKKWDGIWRGIIFDIPEANRRERNFLRQELKWIGCKEIQKSAWITPLDIEKELLAILKLWKKDFAGDMRFLKIGKISGEKEIKAYFKV